ncbi:PAXNEB-domain-containing protein [Mycena sanguinolenta]|uniref:Elongator complex protein 4 n=1 Tax=Mycena sanguinolenta TaxID=230812 RepID=A0A8H6XFD3_9AGAR|nr:PAXNEB-domain-containing protein [Mycena sanguinolenta]
MSFKRKTTSTASTPSTPLLSTGLPSLDDILGGGLPLSCSLVFTAPDVHSAYGELVQRYFVAQGVAAGQRVCFVGNDARAGGGGDAEARRDGEEKITIAWRYEQMKPFQTTVAASKAATADACRTFDLTTRIPPNVVAEARIVEVAVDAAPGSTTRVLERLGEMLADAQGGPIRICIPALGSPGWGDLNAQDILRFLHGLRALLRRHPHGCASVSLPPEWSGDSVAAGWHEKLGWVADGAITMAAFTGNPALAATFPGHHGLLRIHTLPAPTTLVPASDRFSTLRGTGTGGENNLGFKCTRKRLVFETVHLDVEGGVGERRTSAPPTTTVAVQAPASRSVGAAVEVEIEGVPPGRARASEEKEHEAGWIPERCVRLLIECNLI